MKLKSGCLLREIGDSHVVVVTGVSAVDFRGMVTLQNDTALFMYKLLEAETSVAEIAGKLVERYGITQEHALDTTEKFVGKLREINIIED